MTHRFPKESVVLLDNVLEDVFKVQVEFINGGNATLDELFICCGLFIFTFTTNKALKNS